jgi:tetratricopeptide (TPR) repeat protein
MVATSEWARQADSLFDAGKYSEAIEAYTQAIQADPSNAGLYSDRGAAKHRLGNYEAALADYLEAIRIRPKNVQARLNAAAALQKLGRVQEAIEAFEAAAAADPMREVEALAGMADCYAPLGRPAPIPRIKDILDCVNEARAADRANDPRKALAAYDRAIGIDNRLPSLFVSRGLIHRTLGDPVSALADADRALAIRPDWPGGLLERGMIRSAAGNLQGAADDYAAAARLDPDNPWPHNNLAAVLGRMNRFPEAAAEADRALALDPAAAPAYANRAIAREGLKQDDEALADYRKAMGADPSLTRSYRANAVDCQMRIAMRSRSAGEADLAEARKHYDAGLALAEQKHFAQAVEAFTAAIAKAGDVAAFHLQRGLAHLSQDRFDDAAADYRRAAELWPSFALAHSNLAYLLLERKKPAEALAAAEQGLAIDPDSAYLNTYAGRALAARGDHPGAIVRFDRAILHFPDVPGVYWSRALSRWETQDWRGVIDDMAIAVEKDPGLRDEAAKWIPVAEARLKSSAPAGSGTPAAAHAAPPPNAGPMDVPNHGGGRHAADLDFFAGPPPEIGPLVSAHSTLKRGVVPATTAQRIRALVIGLLIGVAIGAGIDILASVESAFWYYAWPIGLGLIGTLGGWGSTEFSHSCTYVGQLGVARYVCKKRRDHITDQRTLLFPWVTELRTSVTRRYRNSVYQGTDYSHAWSDAKGAVHFVIAGTYANEKGAPKDPTDYYHFALAAETTWSYYLLERADEELRRAGYLHFTLAGNDYVRVAPDWIELSFHGKQERRAASDIATVSLSQGQFTIKTADASGWFFKKGVFSFEYGKMANVRLFLLALEKLCRINVT